MVTEFGTFLVKFGRTRRTFFRAAALFQNLLARRTFRLVALAAACGRIALSNPDSYSSLNAPPARKALL